MKQVLRIFCLIPILGLIVACTQMQADRSDAAAVSAPPQQTMDAVSIPSFEAIDVHIDFSDPAETERLTPIPTPTENSTPTPTVSPTPSPVPTQTPAPMAFVASEDLPLPNSETIIQKGRPFWIDGTVTSGAPLIRVSGIIINSKGKVVLQADQTFPESENVLEYRLLDKTFSKSIDCVAENITFQSLALGSYVLQIQAEDALGNDLILAEAPFTVSHDYWLTLQPNNLRGNYTTALAFFGSPERFLFRYKVQNGSTLITVDREWRKQYNAEAVCVNGKAWRCHIDAVPYFEKAGEYINSSFVHISGTMSGKNFDTGAVRLADLVTFNGTIVRRFTNSNQFISHHSFGTAVDINAYYPSHRDVLKNRDIIYREVTENLTYNGIVEIAGQRCYDFTYNGNARVGLCGVPEPIMNYLLYELGFYRAGFSWGVYYPHTSDAMHFTLSELSPKLFTEGDYAMRKVTSYIEDEAQPADSDATASEAGDSGLDP